MLLGLYRTGEEEGTKCPVGDPNLDVMLPVHLGSSMNELGQARERRMSPRSQFGA